MKKIISFFKCIYEAVVYILAGPETHSKDRYDIQEELKTLDGSRKQKF